VLKRLYIENVETQEFVLKVSKILKYTKKQGKNQDESQTVNLVEKSVHIETYQNTQNQQTDKKGIIVKGHQKRNEPIGFIKTYLVG